MVRPFKHLFLVCRFLGDACSRDCCFLPLIGTRPNSAGTGRVGRQVKKNIDNKDKRLPYGCATIRIGLRHPSFYSENGGLSYYVTARKGLWSAMLEQPFELGQSSKPSTRPGCSLGAIRQQEMEADAASFSDLRAPFCVFMIGVSRVGYGQEAHLLPGRFVNSINRINILNVKVNQPWTRTQTIETAQIRRTARPSPPQPFLRQAHPTSSPRPSSYPRLPIYKLALPPRSLLLLRHKEVAK